MNQNTRVTSEQDFITLALAAGSELANKWLQRIGEMEADIRDRLASGAGLELLVNLHPVPSVELRLILIDGSRLRLSTWVISNTNAH